MITFFIGLTLGTSFGFLIGAIMTDAKFADERVEREQEEAADRPRYEADRDRDFAPYTIYAEELAKCIASRGTLDDAAAARCRE